MKNILVTGCAGFIGSNFIPYLLDKYSNYNVINLDLLTYAGDLNNLKEIESNPRYKFIKGDICNRELVEFIFNEYDIQGVIHFAAESHVDNSIKNPGVFIQTNINGTYTLVDVAYKHWMTKPFTCRDKFKECRFHHISTDEVYGTLGHTGLFSESTPYSPNSPYSASKASSDMTIRAYNETFGLNTVITNCSNNYGPSKKSETYNIGGRNERDNLYIVNKICEILDELKPSDKSYKNLITFVEDRAGHDRRYAIDASKIENELGWKADEDFESGIVKTVKWYLEKY